MGTLKRFYSRRLIWSKLFRIFTSLGFFGATISAAIVQPKQEIWYHTGYPRDVAGPRTGMSALTGPTKMRAVFEAVWRHHLCVPKTFLHWIIPLIILHLEF